MVLRIFVAWLVCACPRSFVTRGFAVALTVRPGGLSARAPAAALRSGRAARTRLRQGGSSGRHAVVVMMQEIECDVAIVGGGPAGCTCALYTSRAKHKTVIIDKNPDIGALAVTSHIANYPGIDKRVSGAELLTLMRQQCVSYGTTYARAQCFLVDIKGEFKYVYTPDATYKARALVVASGAMGRPPSFAGEGDYLGRGVSYCATCDAAFYQNSEVCVFGASEEALAEAEVLATFASTVHWITLAPTKGEHADAVAALPNVKHYARTKLLEVLGDDAGVTGVSIAPREPGGDPTTIPVEGCFIYVAGSKPITDFLQGGGVELDAGGGVIADEEMATNVDGVFAVGDIRNTPFKQVVVAASDGCVAAMSIDKYLKGRKSFRVDWIHDGDD